MPTISDPSNRPLRVRPSTTWGWLWNADHEHSYVCDVGGCDGEGWRPTRLWAVRAGRRYVRRREREQARASQPWQTVR